MPVVWPAVGATILPNLGGWFGSIYVRKNYETWYMTLNKPSWTPPKYVFGPVWTMLYSGMGYASYLVWRDGGGFNEKTCLPLTLYGAQLALNWLWTPMFFGYHSIQGGLINILLLGVSAAGCAATFSSVNKTASLIMVPYLAWLGFATSLNYSIYQKNQDKSKPEIKKS